MRAHNIKLLPGSQNCCSSSHRLQSILLIVSISIRTMSRIMLSPSEVYFPVHFNPGPTVWLATLPRTFHLCLQLQLFSGTRPFMFQGWLPHLAAQQRERFHSYSDDRRLSRCMHRANPSTHHWWGAFTCHCHFRRWSQTGHGSKRLLGWPLWAHLWFNPHAPSNRQPLPARYRKHDNLKKRAYKQRVRKIEHGSFIPLVMSLTGGLGNAASVSYRRLASLISAKQDAPYSNKLHHGLCAVYSVSFSLLWSSIQCIHGARSASGRSFKQSIRPLDIVSSEARFSAIG